MVSHSTDLPTHVAMKYGESNTADKWQKRCFFLILTMNYGLLVEVAKFCNCSKNLHMQGCMMGRSAGLPTLVAMKYGGSNMADKWQKQCFFFFNFNHELWVIG